MAATGLVCPRCHTADCARYHGRWLRKRILDFCSGELFTNLPVLRVRFCQGITKSLFPGELWRGCATTTSVLRFVSHTETGSLDQALQWSMEAGQGDETISERTARRWIKRTWDRLPVACVSLHFPLTAGVPALEKLENFLAHSAPRDLLTLRRQWGLSLLDVPGLTKPPCTVTCPKPVFQNPRPAHDPPSGYRARGSRSHLSRRGRPPDE